MRHAVIVSVALATIATPAIAQQSGIKLSDVAGVWHEKTMVGAKDSVVLTIALKATASDKGWTMACPGHAPVPVRIVTVGGDSIVTEAGPYPSCLRPGATVTTLRTVSHFKGNSMWGTFDATYSSGPKLSGKISGQRGM
ncbi:MAG TPA: hypothetical protein VFD76_11705 [Gemmatimonadales bacterium]|jgi:hypothetical protein|nr:hypothetical protein [Gemmatimonadales bacterium]